MLPKGKLLTVHACGNDPTNQIIKKIWPKENPFPSLASDIIKYIKKHLNKEIVKTLNFKDKKIIRCDLRALPNEITGGIATSIVFSAWNASIYVNQIKDDLVLKAEKSKKYENIVSTIVTRNKGLYFNNELFVIEKK